MKAAQASVRIARPRRLALYVIGAGTWLSGALWLLFHFVFVRQGEFGPETHPLEPGVLALHGGFSFAAIWLFGLLWADHITPAWPAARRRLSGGVLAGLLASLTISGYLLYYAGSDTARPIISTLHWTVGLAFPIGFLFHRLKRSRPPGRGRLKRSAALLLSLRGE